MPTAPPRSGSQPDQPILRQKLSDQVFDRLWRMIESGELSPGDAVPSERALMERFGVGRPAVREALQMLANKGMITITHGERSRVNELTAGIAIDQVEDIARLLLSSQPSNLENLKQVRRILEAGTVRIAAATCTDKDISDLRELVAKQRAALGEDRPFMQADIDFHVGLARVTGNPLLETVTSAMLSWLSSYYTPMLRWEGRESTTLREHDEIVRFLSLRDADAAVRMMEDHLNRSNPLYALNQDESGDT